MTILSEIENIDRFADTDHLAGFAGLVPNYRSSGDKASNGEITFRGQSGLKKSLIESAWSAARYDPALSISYHELFKRMDGNKAVTRIARKLLNRIYFVLKNKQQYVHGVVR